MCGWVGVSVLGVGALGIGMLGVGVRCMGVRCMVFGVGVGVGCVNSYVV